MTEYELYHHGILGQKWGRRQGPPYPLDPSDHSAAEKKAGYRKSLGGGRNPESYRSKKAAIKKARKERDRSIQDRYDKEERRIESKYKRGQNLSEKDQKRQAAADKRATDDWAKSKAQYKKEMAELKKEKPGLSDKQKTALKIGAAAVAIGVTAYGAYKLRDYLEVRSESPYHGKKFTLDSLAQFEDGSRMAGYSSNSSNPRKKESYLTSLESNFYDGSRTDAGRSIDAVDSANLKRSPAWRQETREGTEYVSTRPDYRDFGKTGYRVIRTDKGENHIVFQGDEKAARAQFNKDKREYTRNMMALKPGERKRERAERKQYNKEQKAKTEKYLADLKKREDQIEEKRKKYSQQVKRGKIW